MAQRGKFRSGKAWSAKDAFDCSLVLKEKEFSLAEDEEDDDDRPVVFLCAQCKLPVGDSLSWDGCEEHENQIRIKCATDNVIVGKETRLHEVKKGSACLVVDLVCGGCHSSLGVIYTSTPRSLDHKRLVFCFNVADIDSYVLGSAKQMLTAEGPQEQPVYRSRVEKQLTEMKVLVVSLAQRLEAIECGLDDRSDVA